MKKVILTFALFIAIIGSSFGQKFSAQLNTGFNYFLGTKIDKLASGEKGSIGSLITGTIPVGVEFNYNANEQFSIGVHYAYQTGLSYSYTTQIQGQSLALEYNVKSTQNFGLNLKYAFSTGNIAPYAGLDGGIFLWVLKGKIGSVESDFTKTTTAFYVTPKVGAKFKLGEQFFLDANINYMIIPAHKATSAITDAETEDIALSQSIGLGLGLGYTF